MHHLPMFVRAAGFVVAIFIALVVFPLRYWLLMPKNRHALIRTASVISAMLYVAVNFITPFGNTVASLFALMILLADSRVLRAYYANSRVSRIFYKRKLDEPANTDNEKLLAEIRQEIRAVVARYADPPENRL